MHIALIVALLLSQTEGISNFGTWTAGNIFPNQKAFRLPSRRSSTTINLNNAVAHASAHQREIIEALVRLIQNAHRNPQ